MMRFSICAALIAVLPCLAPDISLGQQREPVAKGVARADKIASEAKEASAAFDKAVEVIRSGNDALKKGEDGNAYCLFEEGIMRLNEVKGKYPEWQPEAVKKQIKNTLEVKEKLTATTCENLEKMKEARFRFMVWQRQVLMLDRLEKLEKRLDYYEQEYWNKDSRYIRDIWDAIQRR